MFQSVSRSISTSCRESSCYFKLGQSILETLCYLTSISLKSCNLQLTDRASFVAIMRPLVAYSYSKVNVAAVTFAYAMCVSRCTRNQDTPILAIEWNAARLRTEWVPSSVSPKCC